MKKAAFCLTQAIHGLRGFRLVQAVVAVSFALALVMPCIAFSIIRESSQMGTPYRVTHPDRTLYASVFLPSLELEDRFEALFAAETAMMKLGVKTYGLAHVSNPQYAGKTPQPIGMMSIYGVTAHELDFAYIDIGSMEGRLFSDADFEEARHVCVLGRGMAQAFDVGVGNLIEANGISYEIIGILDAAWEQGTFRIPYGRFADISAHNVQHGFLVEYAQAPDWQALENRFSDMVSAVVQFETVAAQNDARLEAAMEEHRDLLTLSFFMTLVAAVNVLFILYGKMKCSLRSVAVRIAIGARPLALFFEMVCGNLLLFFASIPLLLTVVYWGKARMQTGTGGQVDALVFVQVIGAGAVLCVVLSLATLLGIRRMNVADMMRKGK